MARSDNISNATKFDVVKIHTSIGKCKACSVYPTTNNFLAKLTILFLALTNYMRKIRFTSFIHMQLCFSFSDLCKFH